MVRSFEEAAGGTRAVIARSLLDVERLASSPRQLYAGYYQLLDAEVLLPDEIWGPLRGIADEALFPRYKEKIKFAALSLNDAGVPSYGECSLVLREDRIAHRASAFEGNSALLMQEWAYNLPAGFRATWSQRALLCVAKLARLLMPQTTKVEFAGILLHAGATPAEDDFVEVHVYGPMSCRSFERIVYTRPAGISPEDGTAIADALRVRLAKVGLDLEER